MGKSLVGTTIGRLTVLAIDRKASYKRWICKCNACGTTISLGQKQLKRGNCGCIPSTDSSVTRELIRNLFVNKRMSIAEVSRQTGLHRNTISKYIDRYKFRQEKLYVIEDIQPKEKKRTGPKPHKLIGRQIGDLTVEKYIDVSSVVCRCKCGKRITVPTAQLYSLEITSCGSTHEKQQHIENDMLYLMWNKIVRIGASGEWGTAAEFVDWSYDNGYIMGMTLISEDSSYTPSTCKWVPQDISSIRCNSIVVDICGTVKTLTDWTNELGINYSHAYRRYRDGYRGKDIFT